MAAIVVAHEDAQLRQWLTDALRGLGAIRLVAEGEQLEQLVLSGEPPDLVVASATLSEPNGVQLLAAARASAIRTPFVMITEFSSSHVLAFVSDDHGTQVARRVLGRHAIRTLAGRLIQMRPRW